MFLLLLSCNFPSLQNNTTYTIAQIQSSTLQPLFKYVAGWDYSEDAAQVILQSINNIAGEVLAEVQKRFTDHQISAIAETAEYLS